MRGHGSSGWVAYTTSARGRRRRSGVSARHRGAAEDRGLPVRGDGRSALPRRLGERRRARVPARRRAGSTTPSAARTCATPSATSGRRRRSPAPSGRGMAEADWNDPKLSYVGLRGASTASTSASTPAAGGSDDDAYQLDLIEVTLYGDAGPEAQLPLHHGPLARPQVRAPGLAPRGGLRRRRSAGRRAGSSRRSELCSVEPLDGAARLGALAREEAARPRRRGADPRGSGSSRSASRRSRAAACSRRRRPARSARGRARCSARCRRSSRR